MPEQLDIEPHGPLSARLNHLEESLKKITEVVKEIRDTMRGTDFSPGWGEVIRGLTNDKNNHDSQIKLVEGRVSAIERLETTEDGKKQTWSTLQIWGMAIIPALVVGAIDFLISISHK